MSLHGKNDTHYLVCALRICTNKVMKDISQFVLLVVLLILLVVLLVLQFNTYVVENPLE